ncbi:MAG: indole-3-glycerol phosphate synthase TrpC [Polyangiaceae bacterium]
MSLLADILANKQREVDALRRTPRTGVSRESIDVLAALRRKDPLCVRIIAEVKLRSPSAGVLSHALSPADRAVAYAEAGAAMVSILCDGPHFEGSFEHLTSARARLDGAGTPIPLLAKEFVVDERQIAEARDRGADAVLLIARIVSPARLAELAAAARAEHIEPFVEVIDERELEAALAARARVVGVNARDLDSLRIDVACTGRVLAAIPRGVVAVHLSGLRQPSDVAEIARGRADAALVGEALMRKDDPRALLSSLVSAG